MPTRRALTTFGVAALAGACGAALGGHALRYRLSCTLERDGLETSGHSVMGIEWTNTGALAGFDGIERFETAAFADAVIVDMGALGPVFGLLMASALHEGMAFNALRPERILQRLLDPNEITADSYVSGEIFERMKHIEGEHDVPAPHWPVFMRFRELEDRTSAEPINVAAHGLTVKAVRISISTAPVTRGIQQLLPWLRQLGGANRPRLSGTRFDPASLASQLDRRAFTLSGNEA